MLATLTKLDLQMMEQYWTNHEENKKQLHFLQSQPIAKKKPLKEQHLKDITEAIDAIYQNLDDDYKTIVQMRYWDSGEGSEWLEIADELFMSRSKVLRKRDFLMKQTAERIGWV